MKNTTLFTQGPWLIGGHAFQPFDYGKPRDEAHDPVKYRAFGIGNGACHLAYVSVTRAVGQMEAEANARLIAAAPDMLAALRAILRAHDSKNNGAYMGEAVLCPYFANMARTIIARATGST